MKPLFIVGYMGCGKSTLGRNVAARTPLEFIDLDNYIETRFHATVREIFAEKGEAGFRRLERAMLEEVADFENVIIACGGGTPCFFDNMELMNSKGTTILLDTSLEKLHTRLMRGRHKRPLIADKSDSELRQFIIDALKAREPYYSKARERFAGDLLENEAQVEDTARRFISQFNIPENL